MLKVEKDDYDNKSDDERERDRRRRSERDLKPSRFESLKDRDRSPTRGRKKGTRVYVSNIPYEYRWQELKDLFRDKIGEVSFVEMFVDENDKPRGCGVIEFATPDLAKEAVEKMHRHEINGRKLVVKEDNDNERDKYGRIITARGGGGGGGNSGNMDRGRLGMRDRDRDMPSMSNGPSGPKFGNTYGLSTQFLETLGISAPLVPRVFVANLDYNVDEKKLREVFRLAGRVISCDLSTDKEGKSRGFGVIEFEHPVEAVQAISMFMNQPLYDRKMSVRMDRAGDKGDGLPARLPEGLKSIGMGLGANGAPLQDVARNLPNIVQPQLTPQGLNTTLAAANSALTAAALAGGLGGQLGGVGGLLGAATNDISTLASSLVGSTALAGANPLATAQLLSSTADVMGIRKQAAASLGRTGSLSLGELSRQLRSTGAGLGPAFGGSSGVGRDFDSLSAALGGGGGFSSSTSGVLGGSDSRPLGGSSSSNSDTIVIKNLPVGTTWQMLRDKCRDAGDVKFAEMRAKDAGVVQFGSHWDAQRAINMLDGIRVDGRSLDVRFY